MKIEQLYFEGQRGAAGNRRGLTAIAICDIRWTHDLRLTALLQFLHRFLPAGNNLVQRKLRRFVALNRTVEDRTVDELALVVNLHDVVW